MTAMDVAAASEAAPVADAAETGTAVAPTQALLRPSVALTVLLLVQGAWLGVIGFGLAWLLL